MTDRLSLETAVQVYAIINFIIIGLSHIAQPRAWVKFFLLLKEQGEAGVFANAFLSLLFGSIVVAFHNVWTGIPVVLTIIGWSQVLKALVYFVFPRRGLRGFELVGPEHAHRFIAPGLLFLLLAGLLIFHLVFP
ncbi:MAG TPA: hypothetical protein VE685_19310 [Thermoanaerobaculia bacterium]|nr:hypothetical protein [Thermoanaerobaculia bacterium]